MKNIIINLSLLLASLVICLFTSEFLLGRLGFNSIFSDTYCPNSYNIRRNNEFKYDFKTNSFGLREREVPLEKSKDEIRILFLGDSYTEGVGVKTEERFTSLISSSVKLKEPKTITIINAAITATGPTEYARVLTHIGLKYQPDYIFIGVFANDIQNMAKTFSLKQLTEEYLPAYNLDNSLKSKIKLRFARLYRIYKQTIPNLFGPKFAERTLVEVKNRNVPSKRYEEWKQKITQQVIDDIDSRRVNDIIYTTGLFRPEYFFEALDLVGTQDNLSTMLKTFDYIKTVAINSKIYIIYIPSPFQIIENSHQNDNIWVNTGTLTNPKWLTDISNFEIELNNYSKSHDIVFYDLTGELRLANKTGITTNYKIDGHLNSTGHKIIANTLNKLICNELTCNEN